MEYEKGKKKGAKGKGVGETSVCMVEKGTRAQGHIYDTDLELKSPLGI